MSAFNPDAYAFSAFAIPPAVTAIVMLVFGARLLIRRASSVRAAFFSLAFVLFVWLSAFSLMYLSRDAGVALLWARIGFIGVPLIAPAVYQFAVEMLRIASHRRFAVALAWSLGLAFCIAAISSKVLVTGVVHHWWGFYPRYALTVGLPFVVFVFGYLAAAVGEFVRMHGRSRGVERIRIRLLLIAFGIGYFAAVDFLAAFEIDVYPFGYAAIALFVVLVGQVVRRYDLVPITPSLAANEIINTIADILFVADRDGRIQFANHSAERILGYAAEELVGVRLEDLVMRGDRTEPLQHRSIRSAEYDFRTRAGERVELTLSISPVIHDGAAAGAVIVGRDVRERKRAEREARRAVTLLQSTLDSTADAILVTSGDGRVLSYNQRYLDMWRIPREMVDWGDHKAIIAMLADQLVHPADYLQAIEKLFKAPEAESFDLLEFKDGRHFERYSIGRVIEGVAVVRVWSFRDVTARYNAEAALRESEARYRLLFEQNAAGVYVAKQSGEIIDCNATFALMLGYRRNELIGRNSADLYERRVERDELVAMLHDSHTLNGTEIELHRKDGRKIWVLQNLALVGHGDSAVVHVTLVDVSDRKRAEEQIEFHAYHDVLTDLPNRRLFTDRLGQSMTRARRSGKSLAVFFIDLDHFKAVNDTLGHTAGDELLLEMSQRLRQCVREEDTVARLGGDEFTMVLSDLRHPEDAVQVAEKVLDAIKAPLMIGDTPVHVSASIGIALYPADGYDVETLLRNADSAMYRAKESGRNNYQLCTEEMKRRATERLTLEARLRKAVPGEQLMLLYQPQVNLGSGRMTGVEALVRWNDPDRGMLEPAAFLPVAEETRLILPLGEWVLRAACTQARLWQEAGSPFRISVNVSARQFQHHDFVDMVRRILADTRANASALELEVSEATAMQNPEFSVDVLRELAAIGVTAAIDDFGTGFSSLAYLRRLPVTALKIDRSFIAGALANEGDAAIVNSEIAIAHHLKLRVVAEGVETQDQFAYLQRKQCDEAQGFYFSAPISAEAVSRAIAERRVFGLREPRIFF